MKEINVLILSAGRRVELIERFKRAKNELNIKGKIVSVDISNTAPALYFSDSYHIVPKVAEENYISEIVDVCNKEKIHLIVPTIDTELIKLCENREIIEKNTQAKVLISCKRVIDICRNKNNTQRFFEENGFGVPKQLSDKKIENGEYTFPLFIKPQDGSSSINTFKVNNSNELSFFLSYVDKPIVQEYISGTEYSVDVFCDFEGNLISVVPRIRLAVRSGEILKGQISKDRAIIDDIKKMIEILKPIGHITVQCMKTQKGIEYIEINPRFGGGAPMSIDAGADSCKNLYRLLCGEKLEYNEQYISDVVFARYDNSIRIDI